MDNKTCLDCGEVLVGRSDKKFCNDLCRNNYNNKLNSDASSTMRNINNVLRKNRRIMEEILSKSADGKIVLSQKKLSDKGFNFTYHTHIYTTKTGKNYHYCYEFGYLALDNDLYMVVKRNENL